MKIKINNIKYQDKEGCLSEYAFSKKLNIIMGESETGKTPLMLLLGYSLGNNNMKKAFFQQRMIQDSSWGNEFFWCEYEISHGGTFLKLKVMLETDIKNEKIYMTLNEIVEGGVANIFQKSESSTSIREYFVEKFKIPNKVFWKNTVKVREFDEFHSFFFVVSNLNQKKGRLYDVANTMKAPLNSFISAFAFLTNNEKALAILKKASEFKDLEKITKKLYTIGDMIDSLTTSDSISKAKNLSVKFKNILKKYEENLIKIEDLNIIVKKINLKINRILKTESHLKFAYKYNEIYEGKIDINNYRKILLSFDKLQSKNLPTLIKMKEYKKKEIMDIESKNQEIKNTIEELGIFKGDNLQSLLLGKLEKVRENLNGKLEDEFQITEENEEIFMNIFSRWKEVYISMFDGLGKLIKEKISVEFENRGKFKYGSGGRHHMRYMKIFVRLNEIVNLKGNNLPIIIDSFFETKNESKEETIEVNYQTQIENVVQSNNNQIILTMTKDDYSKIKYDNNLNPAVFDSPGNQKKLKNN